MWKIVRALKVSVYIYINECNMYKFCGYSLCTLVTLIFTLIITHSRTICFAGKPSIKIGFHIFQ